MYKLRARIPHLALTISDPDKRKEKKITEELERLFIIIIS